jgi:hypothetical protein
VPRSEIDQRFFDTPYYITPNEPVGQEAFAVIREAMRSKALVAFGRVVLAKRERVMALDPYEKGLLGRTLRYPYEVRQAKDYFADIPDLTPAPELLQLADGRSPAGGRHVKVHGTRDCVGVSEAPRASVPRLMDGVDTERGAMREQRRLAVAVESDQGLPKTVFVLGQPLCPLLMAGLDHPSGGAAVIPPAIRTFPRLPRRCGRLQSLRGRAH